MWKVLRRLFSRNRPSPVNWVVGGIYSTRDDPDMFHVVKVLACDDNAVHLRLYKNKFRARPVELAVHELTLGTIHDGDGPAGIGHLPLDPRSFSSWDPVLIRTESVDESELEGYRMWQDARGGVWD